jgi:hypothetical protein
MKAALVIPRNRKIYEGEIEVGVLKKLGRDETLGLHDSVSAKLNPPDP